MAATAGLLWPPPARVPEWKCRNRSRGIRSEGEALSKVAAIGTAGHDCFQMARPNGKECMSTDRSDKPKTKVGKPHNPVLNQTASTGNPIGNKAFKPGKQAGYEPGPLEGL